MLAIRELADEIVAIRGPALGRADLMAEMERAAPVAAVLAATRESGMAVLREVASRGGYTVQNLLVDRRTKLLSQARQAAYHEVSVRCPHLSMSALGRLFKRDHTTIIHGIKAHLARVEQRRIAYEEDQRARTEEPPV